MNNDPVAQRNYLALKQKSYAIKFALDGTGYTAHENIGAGAYGVVCSATHEQTKKRVAIKKIPSIFEQLTIAKRTYREIKILKHFKHDNIIAIQEILRPSGGPFKDVYIVLDLMESDLHRIIHSSQPLTEEHVRFFTYQILRGLKYVHSANVLHRDLKPSNLLVNENCDLKIGDFGMARGISTNTEDYSLVMTQYVATRWYRAPELMILPKETYSEAVDMWSVGCILGEMLGRKQLFPGRSHFDQLERIIDKLGTPSSEYLQLTSSDIITGLILQKGHVAGVAWREVYPRASRKAVDLLGRMLVLDPQKRITVTQALQHPFLNKYHDPDDEPICIPVFNFDFERQSLSTDQLKAAITEEIADYQRPKPAARKTAFNFTPVPRTELAAASTGAKFDFRPVPTEELEARTGGRGRVGGGQGRGSHVGGGEEGTSSQGHGKTAVNNTTTNSTASKPAAPKSDFVSDLLSAKDPKALLKEIVRRQQGKLGGEETGPGPGVFKKPEGLPLLVKDADEAGRSSQEVEMLSAQSHGGKAEPLSVRAEHSADVEMPSAQGTGHDKGAVPASQHTGQDKSTVPADGPQATDTKPPDTKELIRMALLSNERRKQKEQSVSKPKPITALQRQREREEKRRQKLEKIKQKKKKTKEKQKSPVELTDEDKALLQKWKTMQQKPDKPAQQPGHTTGPESLNHKPSSVSESQGCSAEREASSLSDVSVVPQSVELPPGALPSSDDSDGFVTMFENTLPDSLPPRTDLAADAQFGWLDPSTSGVKSSMLPSYREAVKATTWVPGQAAQPAAQPAEAKPWDPAPRPTSDLFSDTTNMSQLQQTQWMLSRLENSGQAAATASKAAGPAVHHDLQTPDNTRLQPTDPQPPERTPALTKADQDMRIITKQLRQSLVEDLTLRSTPKGTGGGYGVACDLDLLMESAGADSKLDKPDSAALSPSLFNDWRELTGNLDPREFENVLQEYMTSPISSQELNNVMLSLMSPRSSSKVS